MDSSKVSQTKQVDKAQMSRLPFIIAVDFDGTLVEDRFPGIGGANKELFIALKYWREQGCKLILWTCRDNDTDQKQLTNAVNFCSDEGLEFDAVNKNIPEVIEMFKNDTRKIYANVYIDDKNMIPDLPDNWKPMDFKPWDMNKEY